jgi:hypothetical protein
MVRRGDVSLSSPWRKMPATQRPRLPPRSLSGWSSCSNLIVHGFSSGALNKPEVDGQSNGHRRPFQEMPISRRAVLSVDGVESWKFPAQNSPNAAPRIMRLARRITRMTRLTLLHRTRLRALRRAVAGERAAPGRCSGTLGQRDCGWLKAKACCPGRAARL